MLDRTPPEVGSVWRERRRMYRLRTVRVVEVDQSPGGFVYVYTVTRTDGTEVIPHDRKPDGSLRKSSRVSLRIWHESWELA
jgi:hypothetical protein